MTSDLPGLTGLLVQAGHWWLQSHVPAELSLGSTNVWACQNGARTGVLWQPGVGRLHHGPAMPSPSAEMQEIGLLLPVYTRDEELHAGSCRIRLPDGDLLSSSFFNEHSL